MVDFLEAKILEAGVGSTELTIDTLKRMVIAAFAMKSDPIDMQRDSLVLTRKISAGTAMNKYREITLEGKHVQSVVTFRL